MFANNTYAFNSFTLLPAFVMFKVVLVVGIVVDVRQYPTVVLICVSLMVMVSVFPISISLF